MKVIFTIDKDRFRVQSPYAPALVDRFKTIPGYQYHPETREWSFPAVRDCLAMASDATGVMPWQLPPGLREIADDARHIDRVGLDVSVVAHYPWTIPPLAHQVPNLARLVANDRWLLADDMGTGKSYVVASREKWFRISRRSREDFLLVLVLCPKSVRREWCEQFIVGSGITPWVVEGDKDRRRHDLKVRAGRGMADNNVVVANYELLLSDAKEFLEVPWDMVVFDEVHRLKNFTAKTSKVARQLSAKARYVYGLSGTPVPNGLEDWLGVISAVDPNLLPVSTKTAFQARYCVMGRLTEDRENPYYHTKKVVGYRNVAELHSYVSRITSRVTKEEALDLPSKTFVTGTVNLEGEQARVYKELKRDAVARLRDARREAIQNHGLGPDLTAAQAANWEFEGGAALTVNNVLTESLRLLQVVGGFVPDDDGVMHELPDKAKVHALADVVDEVGNRQLVVWCKFREEVKYLAAWLDKTFGGGVVTLTGDVSGDDRATNVDAFKNGDARFFVGTSAAGGTGINGLQVADTEVFYSRDWRLDHYLQATDRLHRIGQKNAVTVVKVVAESTVDECVEEALERKKSIQELLTMKPEELF